MDVSPPAFLKSDFKKALLFKPYIKQSCNWEITFEDKVEDLFISRHVTVLTTNKCIMWMKWASLYLVIFSLKLITTIMKSSMQ